MTMKLSGEMNEQPPSGWLTMRNGGKLMGVEDVRGWGKHLLWLHYGKENKGNHDHDHPLE